MYKRQAERVSSSPIVRAGGRERQLGFPGKRQMGARDTEDLKTYLSHTKLTRQVNFAPRLMNKVSLAPNACLVLPPSSLHTVSGLPFLEAVFFHLPFKVSESWSFEGYKGCTYTSPVGLYFISLFPSPPGAHG